MCIKEHNIIAVTCLVRCLQCSTTCQGHISIILLSVKLCISESKWCKAVVFTNILRRATYEDLNITLIVLMVINNDSQCLRTKTKMKQQSLYLFISYVLHT